MHRVTFSARSGLVLAAFVASLSLAQADEAPAANAPTAAPLSQEAVSLQGFAAQNLLCLEWTDNCSVCLRDQKGVAQCSTPGIACQPATIVCRQEKPK
jgi:hypothetical protein